MVRNLAGSLLSEEKKPGQVDGRLEGDLSGENELPRDRTVSKRDDIPLWTEAVDTGEIYEWGDAGDTRIHVVECVVSIHPELALHLFGESYILLQSHIDVPEARTPGRVAARISDLVKRREREWPQRGIACRQGIEG